MKLAVIVIGTKIMGIENNDKEDSYGERVVIEPL